MSLSYLQSNNLETIAGAVGILRFALWQAQAAREVEAMGYAKTDEHYQGLLSDKIIMLYEAHRSGERKHCLQWLLR